MDNQGKALLILALAGAAVLAGGAASARPARRDEDEEVETHETHYAQPPPAAPPAPTVREVHYDESPVVRPAVRPTPPAPPPPPPPPAQPAPQQTATQPSQRTLTDASGRPLQTTPGGQQVAPQPIPGAYTDPTGRTVQVPAGGTAGAPAASSGSTPRLGTGIDRDDVIFAQRVLRALGYTVAVDGAWGSQTSTALRSFQGAANRERGWSLSVDGALGANSMRALRWYARRGYYATRAAARNGDVYDYIANEQNFSAVMREGPIGFDADLVDEWWYERLPAPSSTTIRSRPAPARW